MGLTFLNESLDSGLGIEKCQRGVTEPKPDPTDV